MNRWTAALCSLAAVVWLAAPCAGDFIYWQGAGTGGITATSHADSHTEWNRSSNWTPRLPGAFDVAELSFENPGNVFIDSSDTVRFIYLNGDVSEARLVIRSGAELEVRNGFFVPYTGRAEVVHEGGTIAADFHYVGGRARGPHAGRYQFDGGTLGVEKLFIGLEGTGHFEQNGGDLTVPDLMQIGPGGRFDSLGGQFSFGGRLVVDGVLDYHGRAATLNLPAQHLSDISGSLANSQQLQINVPSDSLLVLPAGFDPPTQLAGVTGSGLVHIRGSTLTIPVGQSFAAPSGDFRDPVDISGEMTPGGFGMTLAGGGILRPGGAIQYQDRTLYLSGGSLELAGGSIVADRVQTAEGTQIVQRTGTEVVADSVVTGGQYTHEGGMITADRIQAASGGQFTTTANLLSGVQELQSSFGGQFVLAGSAVDVPLIRSNRGDFLQTSGHTVTDRLELIGGRFTLQGGSLTVRELILQNDSAGEFIVSDPTASITITDRLRFGPDAAFRSITAADGAILRMRNASVEHDGINVALRWPGGPRPRNDARDKLRNVEMVFENPGGMVSTIEVPGADLGSVSAGFDLNFAIGTLRIGGAQPGRVQLVDESANLCQQFICPPRDKHDALYVDHLILHDNATLDLNGLNLYYRELTHLGGVVQPNGGLLLAVPDLLPGDFDGDGYVDGDDLLDMILHFGTQSGAELAHGDADRDGDVDRADYGIWRDNVRAGISPVPHATVPEPGTFLLGSLSVAILLLLRSQGLNRLATRLLGP